MKVWDPPITITASKAGRFPPTGASPMSSTLKPRLVVGAVLALGVMATPLTVEGQSYTGDYRFGTPATQADIDAWNKDVRPDGTGLPPGSGTFEGGQRLFAERCAVCHGQNLEGIS